MISTMLGYMLWRSRGLQAALLLTALMLSICGCKTCDCNDTVAQYRSGRYNPWLIFDSIGLGRDNTDAEQFGRSPWPRPVMDNSYLTPSEKLTYNESTYLRQCATGSSVREHFHRRVWGGHRRDTTR